MIHSRGTPARREEQRPMPNTGQFYLLRVDSQADQAERLLEVTAVECSCLPCGWTFTASPS